MESKQFIPRDSAVFQAGGPYATVWEFGFYSGLHDMTGLDLSEAPLQGTSGGGFTAAFIATRKNRTQVEGLPQIDIPNRTPGYLEQAVGRPVLGNERADNVSVIAAAKPFFRPRKLSGHDLAVMASATSAIPGVYHSVEIDGTEYFDGGASLPFPSLTHAHRAAPAERLLVFAPLAAEFNPSVGPITVPIGRLARRLTIGPLKGIIPDTKVTIGPAKSPIPAGKIFEAMARREMAQWKRKHGGEALIFTPNRETSELIKDFNDLFDFDVQWDVHDAAYEHAVRMVRQRSRHLGSLALDTKAA
jgi:hypothetical protein